MTAVLLAPGRSPGDVRCCHTDLRHHSTEDLLEVQDTFLSSSSRAYSPYPEASSSYAHSAPVSSTFSAYTPSASRSLSLDASDESTDEEDIIFPSYDDDYSPERTVKSDTVSDVESANPSPDTRSEMSPSGRPHPAPRTASDDTAVENEPSRHVDYLSYDWREEDIWSSWRYVISRRNNYANAVRLENASWRTWAKSKYKLRTVSPETLNWLKDCDVTWLYGPLQTEDKQPTVSSTGSRLGTPTSHKSILKKKTASEIILQRSLSQNMLLKHAGAILKAREAENGRGRPSFERRASDTGVTQMQGIDSAFGSMETTPTNGTSSGLTSPGEKRHIHFNNEVVQCIAVEAKGTDDYDCWSQPYDDDDDDESSDDGLVIMKRPPSRARAPIHRKRSPTKSVSNENKIIAPLPPTTLKYRGDTPEPPSEPPVGLSERQTSKLTQSPSAETLRPTKSQANFLLDDDDELDMDWQPRQSGPDRPWFVNAKDEDSENDSGLHLTPSGMFMPYEETEGSSTGIFDRVINTVNTARDIAHVIWNVGWRR